MSIKNPQPQGIHRILLIIIMYGTGLIFGLLENIKGVAYPLIKTEFGVSYEQQGGFVALLSYSYVFFCLIAGVFLGRFGVKRSLLSGFLCSILGALLVYVMPGYVTIGAALFLVYAAFGFFEVGMNALATQLFTAKAALFMSLLHFFYGAGAIIGPKAAGFLINTGKFSWRHVYLFTLPVVLALFIPAVITRFPKDGGEGVPSAPDGGAAGAEKTLSFLGALKLPMVWLFSLMLGLMEVVEFSSANWGGLYFQDVYALDPRTDGAAFISNFYLLFTVSRLVSGFAIEKIGYMRSLFIASFAAVFIYALGFGLGARGIWVLPALGFFIAIMWPTVMAMAMKFFGSQAPVITSAIIVLSGAINSGVQFVVGLTNRLAGAAWGYRSCLGYALILIAVLFFLNSRMRARGTLPGEAIQ
ncbi:MAG: MFS transporter [Spirochaetaceae bacterium]|jgi:fucose permease|nr:MFS transporter [Spirochaetaceae bacterium]